MTSPALLTAFARETWVWLAVTVILGGAAAFVTGQALARAWRGLGRATIYAALLAFASCFLCYALFHVSAIPMNALIAAAVARDAARVAPLLAVWGASFVILALFAAAGWRLMRGKMMAQQYGFRAVAASGTQGVTSH